MKKSKINVRRYAAGMNHHSTSEYENIGSIKRVLRAECIGNFNPVFCTYKGKRTLVYSDAGDLSDPFRRDDSYSASLFIETH